MVEITSCCFCRLVVVFTMLYISHQSSVAESSLVYDVRSFGAKPNGVTDSTRAFLNAWAAACASSNDSITISVPKGRYLLPSAMVFKGDKCKNTDITFRVDGTLMASSDYRVLGRASNWLSFVRVTGISIVGGTLDAKGTSLWACKLAGGSTDCPNGATSLRFTNSKNISIKGVTSLNSQIFHIVLNGCQDVEIEGVTVNAAGNSPNTDGIHVQLSRNVAIFNTSIKTGDDCVSVGPGTKDLWIEQISCGPGHGISIGSLAKDFEEEGVQNVTIKKAVLKGTTNGLRIKSWARPSKGFVQRIQFLDAVMLNVKNPILIDQNYCPRNIDCPAQGSGVRISDVLYQNIEGTSASAVAIKFDCSPSNPCSGLRLENVTLTYRNKVVQSHCINVNVNTSGIVQQDACL